MLTRPRLRRLSQAMLVVAVLVTAACGFIGIGFGSSSDRVVYLTRLPTFTRTPLPPFNLVAFATPVPGAAPVEAFADLTQAQAPLADGSQPASVTSAEAPAPDGSTGGGLDSGAGETTETPVTASNSPSAPPAATPTSPANTPVRTPAAAGSSPSSAGWDFTATRTEQEEDGLLLYGEMINQTGVSQELFLISGTFYDQQGQVIGGEDDTDDYSPLDVIPPEGRVPFELTIYDVQGIANFELWAESEAVNDTPRQDFEFLEVNQSDDAGVYCLNGLVRNPGGELDDYLVVVAVLYDGEGHVVNFGDDYYTDLEGVVGNETIEFEICVAPPNRNVARHELRAWGQ